MSQTNNLGMGTGIYTVSEISRILRLPYFKVNRWLNKYWDGQLGKIFDKRYSTDIDNTKAVSFYTLVEFYVVYQLLNSGVKINHIIRARIELTKKIKSDYPFAQKTIIENLRTDGNRVYFDLGDHDILSLDGTKQLNISFIENFYVNLDFDHELMATKFWPLGKDKNIIVDPARQFGHPVIDKTNIYPETLFNLYKGGEEIKFIAYMYDINEKDVNDAVEYCQAA